MRPVVLAAAVCGCLAWVAGPAAAAPRTAAATDVEPVEIIADLEVRLAVSIGGDVVKDTVVTSTPGDMKCGGAKYEYERNDRRQCWTRIRRGRQTVLAAQANGRYGVDWRVDWTGCQVIAPGAACELSPKQDAVVTAQFTRLTPAG